MNSNDPVDQLVASFVWCFRVCVMRCEVRRKVGHQTSDIVLMRTHTKSPAQCHIGRRSYRFETRLKVFG